MKPHEEELAFLINSADASIIECFTNSENLCRQLEKHGGEPICIPPCDAHTLRGQLAQRLDRVYVIRARQLRFLSRDELKNELRTRRRDRERAKAALSEEEKAKRAKKAEWARNWRARQTPEKKAQIYETIQRAKKNATEYELELRRKQERERWAKKSATERAEIRERKRAREAAKRAQGDS